MTKNKNKVHLQGKVIKDLKYGHTTLGEMFFKMTVGVPRLSGAVDEIPVIISERVPGIISIKDQEMICIDGYFHMCLHRQSSCLFIFLNQLFKFRT